MDNEEPKHCLGCGTELNHLDEDPNGDENCTCAKCRAEEEHDFDREPNVKFDRDGSRAEKVEPLIRLYFCDPFLLSAEEFEKMAKDVWARLVTRVPEIGDKVLLRLIFEMTPRYCEVKQQLGQEPDPIVIGFADRYEQYWAKGRSKHVQRFYDKAQVKG